MDVSLSTVPADMETEETIARVAEYVSLTEH
ncbi:hypothetical protein J2T60_002030 [Natronospira proteinivora]|uniref:Uncharacterized protein n=1 Tax=Natronospira proteinivora TaxID=1807133 RepID=A0ABT1G9M8_9GAMM|nr:hypothetical protein [Natronospira proteinivora]